MRKLWGSWSSQTSWDRMVLLAVSRKQKIMVMHPNLAWETCPTINQVRCNLREVQNHILFFMLSRGPVANRNWFMAPFPRGPLKSFLPKGKANLFAQ
mmetsp:Transcript_49359/g.107506  ORF Transcript_49359/g.107506 Transcript_49359/m.107506 type:complete len:97 (+) Transcript_49359:181-471(+)